jgi:hypothetical protein
MTRTKEIVKRSNGGRHSQTSRSPTEVFAIKERERQSAEEILLQHVQDVVNVGRRQKKSKAEYWRKKGTLRVR